MANNNNLKYLPDIYNNNLNEGENSFFHFESDKICTILETEITNYLDIFEANFKEKL